MSITFKRRQGQPGRLHIGYEKTTWSKVWYEPVGEPDGDGTATLGVYSKFHGEPQRREPMEGQIAWLPFYDQKSFLSDAKKERERLRDQFMLDGYNYLNSKDPVQQERLEDGRPDGDQRWKSWLGEARMKQRSDNAARRRRRTQRAAVARAAGMDPDEVEQNSDPSDSEADSGYEDEEHVYNHIRTATPMESSANYRERRRDTSGNGGIGGGQPALRGRRQGSRHHSETSSDHELFMSDGLNSARSNNRDQTSLSEFNGYPGLSSHVFDASQRVGIMHDSRSPEPAPGSESALSSEMQSLGSSVLTPGGNIGRSGTMQSPHALGRDSGPFTGLDPAHVQHRLRERYANGGLNEDEAVRAAIRASQVPEERPGPLPTPLSTSSVNDGWGNNVVRPTVETDGAEVD